ncbi:MAG: sensor domain-containing diguanylate cyclase [Alkalibacterium sp.]|nr:sensor domain-containing diguanylate cyclase [Alkalibacterium sp.]TVP89557.1 MAG: sensor domain-containing diguanylate cyclase [Alkalibacterium sp.]
MKKWVISSFVAFLAALALIVPVHMLRNQYAEQAYQEHRNQAREHLSFIRNNMQSNLDNSLFYADFFEMVIRQNPDISDYELREYARLIVGRNPVVDNVTIAQDGIITFVYPSLGNEKVMGLSILDDEEKETTYIYSSRDSHLTFAEGPVDAVQGELKIFNRKPVFSRSVSTESFWGFATVTLDFEELLQSTFSVHQHQDYRYGINVTSESGDRLTWGDNSVFDEEAVMQSITLPESSWVIGLMPTEGWRTRDGLFQRELIVFYTLISIIFCLVFFFSLQYVIKRELSRKDPLTGVFNKHTFENIASRLIRYSSQKNGIFLIDFNDFKQINDEYGHLAGDRVLKICSQRMREVVKKSDRVGRIGGDEFMIVTMDVENEENLEKIAERITTYIQRPVRYNDQIIRPTVSVGYILTSNLDVFDHLYDSVDKKMYENKGELKRFSSESI